MVDLTLLNTTLLFNKNNINIVIIIVSIRLLFE